MLSNVYLPVYNMPVNTFIEELNEVFNDLSSLINGCNVDHVIIGGDFNTSFSRKGHNTDLLLSFMDKEYIHCGLEYSESSVDFTFESKSSGSRSIIDHFLLSETLIKMFYCMNRCMIMTIFLTIHLLWYSWMCQFLTVLIYLNLIQILLCGTKLIVLI